jgi:hypothetical protein
VAGSERGIASAGAHGPKAEIQREAQKQDENEEGEEATGFFAHAAMLAPA